MPRIRRIVELTAGNLLVLLIIVLAADLVARVATRGRQYTIFEDPALFVGDRPFIVAHPRRGFGLEPGFSGGQIHVNSQGFRGGEFPKDLDRRVRVLAVGESTTFGWNVGDNDTYPFYLEQFLRRETGNSVSVINAGVPSYTSLQTRLYLDELLPRFRPDVVVVNEIWNDIWYSSLRNWYPEMLVWRKPSGWRMFLLKRSALYRAFAARADSDEVETDVFNEEAMSFYEENLSGIVDACRAAGARVVFMHAPFDPTRVEDRVAEAGQSRFTGSFIVGLEWRYSDAMERVAERYGVPVVLHELAAKRSPDSSYFSDSVHPRPEGNRLMAESVGRMIVESGYVKGR